MLLCSAFFLLLVPAVRFVDLCVCVVQLFFVQFDVCLLGACCCLLLSLFNVCLRVCYFCFVLFFDYVYVIFDDCYVLLCCVVLFCFFLLFSCLLLIQFPVAV